MIILMPLNNRKMAKAEIKQPTIKMGIYKGLSGLLKAILNNIGPINKLNKEKTNVFTPFINKVLSVLFVSMIIILNC